MPETTPSTAQPAPPKLLGGARIKLLVAGVAGAVLVLGLITRPSVTVKQPITAPEDRAAPLLEAELAKRQSLAAFERLQEIGGRVVGYGVNVAVPAAHPLRTKGDLGYGEPAEASMSGAGVVVSPDGQVLTHADALAHSSLSQTFLPVGGTPCEGTIQAYEPETGLVLFALDRCVDLAAAPLSLQPVLAGTVTTAAGRTADGDFIAPAVIVGVTRNGYRLDVSALPAGMPLYDSEGGLVAVAGAAGIAYPAGPAFSRLTALKASGRGTPSAIGVALQPIDVALTDWFGEVGAIVSDVASAGPAAAAGLMPGDVITAIDGTASGDLTETAARLQAAPPGIPLTLEVLRDRKTEPVVVTPYAALLARNATGPEPPPTDRPRLGDVLDGAHLRGDAPADAVVLSVNGRETTSAAQAARAITQARGASLLYLATRNQRWFVSAAKDPS